MANTKGEIIFERGFGLRASGNNYLSEMVALLAAILLMPENMNITIWTDAKSVVDSIVSMGHVTTAQTDTSTLFTRHSASE